jgi:hypothetical protein
VIFLQLNNLLGLYLALCRVLRGIEHYCNPEIYYRGTFWFNVTGSEKSGLLFLNYLINCVEWRIYAQ